MTFTFFASETYDGGTIGAQLTDNGLNELFRPIPKSILVGGGSTLQKAWVKPDSDGEFWYFMDLQAYAGSPKASLYWFVSAGANDTVSDLTGNEDRYGIGEVISNTDTDFTISADANYTIWRAGDYVELEGEALRKISAVTDNGDGTLTIAIDGDFGGNDYSGYVAYGAYYVNGAANTAYPVWAEIATPANAGGDGGNLTTTLLTEY